MRAMSTAYKVALNRALRQIAKTQTVNVLYHEHGRGIMEQLKQLTENQRLRATADELIGMCGFHADLLGTQYLVDAVILSCARPNGRVGDIYAIVAQLHNATPKTVMRNINYSISQARDLDKQLSAIVGTEIFGNELKNGRVIAHLGRSMSSYLNSGR